MKLKIWVDQEGRRHTSLGDTEISSILRSLTLYNCATRSPEVELEVLPSCIEVEVEAEINIDLNGKKYRLKGAKDGYGVNR